MLRLTAMYLSLVVKKPIILVVLALFIVLAIAHIGVLQSLRNRYPVNIWDYMYLSLGGVMRYQRLWELFGWISTMMPLLLLVYLLELPQQYYGILMTRLGSRAWLWLSSSLALMIMATLYAGTYALIQLMIGVMVFSCKPYFSPFFLHNFSTVASLYPSPLHVLFFVTLLFFIGCMAFTMLAQAVALMVRRSFSLYALFSVALFAGGVAYVIGSWPRLLSPLIYGSFMDLFQMHGANAFTYPSALADDIFAVFVCSAASIFLVRGYPY